MRILKTTHYLCKTRRNRHLNSENMPRYAPFNPLHFKIFRGRPPDHPVINWVINADIEIHVFLSLGHWGHWNVSSRWVKENNKITRYSRPIEWSFFFFFNILPPFFLGQLFNSALVADVSRYLSLSFVDRPNKFINTSFWI